MAEPTEPKQVKDRSTVFMVLQTITSVVSALATLGAALSPPGGFKNTYFIFVAIFVVLGLILTFLKARNEKKFNDAKLARANADKKKEADKAEDFSKQLNAERIRILTITNGAFQVSAKQLEELVAMPLNQRQAEVSGYRDSIVSKACDLVRNERPRAAYFKVEDPSAERRTMRPLHPAQKERTDEFTSHFTEGSGTDEKVWPFIDSADSPMHAEDLGKRVPEGVDPLRPRAYKSFISMPVRSSNVAFGMLTVNCIEPNGFTAEDVAAIKVLARLLAVAEVTSYSPQNWRRLQAKRAAITQMSGIGGNMVTNMEEVK